MPDSTRDTRKPQRVEWWALARKDDYGEDRLLLLASVGSGKDRRYYQIEFAADGPGHKSAILCGGWEAEDAEDGEHG